MVASNPAIVNVSCCGLLGYFCSELLQYFEDWAKLPLWRIITGKITDTAVENIGPWINIAAEFGDGGLVQFWWKKAQKHVWY